MNKLPEDCGRELRDEALIARHIEQGSPPHDPELAADWALKRELSQLNESSLPLALRQRVMASAQPPRGAPWLLAAAAGVAALAVVIGVVRQSPAPEPGLAEFSLAMATISDTSRRAMWLAGRELPQDLHVPDLKLDELPYAGAVRSALRTRSNAPDTPHNEENHP